MFVQDLRQAARAMAKHPGYLATALLTLALGIGFSTATFSVVNAVLLRPLPYANPHELLTLRERRLPQFPEFSVSPGHYLAWREHATVFQGIGAWQVQLRNLDTGSTEPDRVRVDRVSANLFALLGVTPVAGRAFNEADDVVGAPAVVLISHGAWQRRFGGADVVGQIVRMDREPVTIVGVMPADFVFPSAETEMWRPFAMTAAERRSDGSHYLSAIARMKPGVTLEQAQADLTAAFARLVQSRPDGNNTGWEILAFSMHEYSVRNVRLALWVLLGAVSFVLLIACVNVANLLLARGASRQKELAIRAAIGASRGRLIQQLLVEQLATALVSAMAGVLVAAWLLRALLALIPNALPRQADIQLDTHVLAFALGLALITPVIFGLFPALQASRPELRELLATGGRYGTSAPARRIRRGLVVAEIALAMILLVGAGLLIRSFANLADVSPGFAPDRAVVVGVNLPTDRYQAGEPRERFFGELLARLRALPQVSAVGFSQSIPMVNDFVSGYEVEGRPSPDGNNPTTNFYAVSPGYFEAMRIPLRGGRLIAEEDRRGSMRVVVINQTLADRSFASVDPIGRRIKVSQGDSEWREIIGIVGDVKQYGLGERDSAQVYEPYPQHPYFAGFSIVVRTGVADATSVVPDLRSVVRSLDAEIPLARVRTLDDIVSSSIRPQRFSTTLIVLFSGAALLLAAIGVYGVMAYTVGSRTQEFAIRIAHGAGRGDILKLVLGGAASMAGLGVAAGLVAAWFLRQVIEKLLYGVSGEDWTTYVTVAVILTAVALAASALPALRATRVDPMVALRGD